MRIDPEDIDEEQLSQAVVRVLLGRPNWTCIEDSLTRRVVRVTYTKRVRGKRRRKFERRIKRAIRSLDGKGVFYVERYKAVNNRIRLHVSADCGLFVRLPMSLDAPVRRSVEAFYARITKDVSNEQWEQAVRELHRKVDRLSKARPRWLRVLADRVELLHKAVASSGGRFVGDLDVRLRGGILYFLEGSDVIDDHIPGYGFLDDGYVVNLCLKALLTDPEGFAFLSGEGLLEL